MAVRIQVRRDSAANWVANNPTLREGEMGIEIDTLKIKIGPTPVSGDATAWNSISTYANVVPADFDTIADGFLEFTDIGAQGGVVGLNSSKNAIIPGSSIIIEGPTADSYETTLTVTDPTADRTITLPDASGTIALTSDLPQITITQVDASGTPTETYSGISTIAFDEDSGFDVTNPSTGVAKIAMNSTFKYWEVDGVQKLTAVALDTVNFISGTGIDITADGNSDPQSITINADIAEILPDQAIHTGKFLQTDGSVTSWATVDLSTKQDKVTGVSDTEIGYLDGVTSKIQDQLDDKSAIDSPTFTGTPAAPTAAAGTDTTQIATTAFVKKAVDDLIGGAPGALDTLNELAAAINDDGSYAATISTALGNKQDKVSGISDTEIGYLNGVTSNIQDQLNDKAASADIAELAQDAVGNNVGTGLTYNDTTGSIGVDHAEITTIVVEGASGNSYGLVGTSVYLDVKDTNGYNKEIELDINAVEAQLDTDGYITESSTSTLSNKTIQDPEIIIGAGLGNITITNTEIGYLDGVSANIQDQLDDKAPLASPVFTGGISITDGAGLVSEGLIEAFGGLYVSGDTTIDGDLLVNGVTTSINTANTSVADNMIYLNEAITYTITDAVGDGTSQVYTTSVDHDLTTSMVVRIDGMNPSEYNQSSYAAITAVTADSFTILGSKTGTFVSGGEAHGKSNVNPDLGISGGYNDGTYHHAGLFRDASDGTWKFFQGYEPEPSGAFIDTSDASFELAPLKVAAFEADSITVGDVSNTEIGYLNGVTSNIQDQIDDIPAPYITSVSSPFFVYQGDLLHETYLTKPVSAVVSASEVLAVATLGTSGSKATFTMNSDTNYPVFDGKQFEGASTGASHRLLVTDGTSGLPRGIYNVTTEGFPGNKGPGQAAVFTFSDDQPYQLVGIVLSIDGDNNGKIYSNGSFGVWEANATESYLQTTLSGITQTINGDIALKADITYVDTELGDKLDSATAASTYAPIDAPALTGNATAVNLTISGDLVVNGTTTNINSTNLVIEDKNIVLGDVTTPSNITANGGGITLNGDTNKTFNWVNSTGAWTSSEHLDLVSGKVLKIDGTQVLSASQYTGNAATVTNGVYTTGSYSDPSWLTITKSGVGLGNVENTKLSTWAGSSSITTLGTIETGTWSATTIGTTKGGTGLTGYTSGDILYASGTDTLAALAKGSDGQVLTLDSGVPTWAAAAVTYSAPTIGSTEIGSGSTVAKIDGLTLGATKSVAISSNSATAIDTVALSGFTTSRYIVSIKQNSKVRSSVVVAQTDGTSVDYTEYGIVETGGKMTGVLPEVVVSSTNAVFRVTITDAASTNATVKIQKVLI